MSVRTRPYKQPAAELLVYAVGDSVMWGEGLAPEHKFASLAAASLANARGLTWRVEMLAHCGATIKSTKDERERFADWFPRYFGRQRRDAFIGSDDADVVEERPAMELHGEIPRPFPTIHDQLRKIPDEHAARVNVLLITGGSNDLDFEKVLRTEKLQELEDDYKRIFYQDVRNLIVSARGRCPNAQIVFTGYYSAFSADSPFSSMRELFLTLDRKGELYKFFATVRFLSPGVGLVLGLLPSLVMRDLVDWIFDNPDDKIEAAVELARTSSESGESRALHWIRRAITEINEDPEFATIKGPGVVFAAPGFQPSNCMFAKNSFVWQKFREKELDDDAQLVRAETCPRNRLRDTMEEMAFNWEPPHTSTKWSTNSSWYLARAELLRILADDLDGPIALRNDIYKLVEDPFNHELAWSIKRLLKVEVDRIDRTRISSLIHPNREGAKRYAAAIHKRAEELRQMSLRERLRAFLPPAERDPLPFRLEVRRTIHRFGLDPAAGLRICLAHAEPDVLGLELHTNRISDPIAGDVYLNLGGGGRWLLRYLLMGPALNPHLMPGASDLFTIDVAQQISIGDITQLVIEIGAPREGAHWEPDGFTFFIDGRVVHHVDWPTPPKVSQSLDLGFPFLHEPPRRRRATVEPQV